MKDVHKLLIVSSTQDDDKVCGSDGKEYKNGCELKVASCKQQKFIEQINRGPCGMSVYLIIDHVVCKIVCLLNQWPCGMSVC